MGVVIAHGAPVMTRRMRAVYRTHNVDLHVCARCIFLGLSGAHMRGVCWRFGQSARWYAGSEEDPRYEGG